MSKPFDTIAIIGGGFTGAAVAFHLARSDVGARILVVEPRQDLGGGLAYDVDDDTFRINVPASKMSLVPGDDGHFARWIEESGAVADDAEALAGDGHLYPRRSVFGRYVADYVAPFLRDRRIVHVRALATRIARQDEGWTIVTDSGHGYAAGIVILATTHPPPSVPSILDKALRGDPRLIADTAVPGVLATIPADARVLIVGTGLTMADVVASLDARGHTGKITSLSRRGLRSRGHPARTTEPFGIFTDRAHTARSLLAAVRRTIEEAAAQGLSWHPVLDAVRAQAQTIWPKLSILEQRRIVRHLRPFWDVHRFRIAPQVEAVLDRRLTLGTLEIISASLQGAAANPRGIEVDIKRRQDGKIERLTVDNVVITTGPAHGSVIVTEPHLASLAQCGLIVRDDAGLGIACDRRGHAFDDEGRAVANLLVAGPLARGTFGELMGLPQVSDYAVQIAVEAARVWRAEYERRPALQAGDA